MKSHSKTTVWIDPNCPREIAAIIFNRKADDERIIAQRRWSGPTKPRKPQRPCDHGLFSDDPDQLDLVSWITEQSER